MAARSWFSAVLRNGALQCSVFDQLNSSVSTSRSEVGGSGSGCSCTNTNININTNTTIYDILDSHIKTKKPKQKAGVNGPTGSQNVNINKNENENDPKNETENVKKGYNSWSSRFFTYPLYSQEFDIAVELEKVGVIGPNKNVHAYNHYKNHKVKSTSDGLNNNNSSNNNNNSTTNSNNNSNNNNETNIMSFDASLYENKHGGMERDLFVNALISKRMQRYLGYVSHSNNNVTNSDNGKYICNSNDSNNDNLTIEVKIIKMNIIKMNFYFVEEIKMNRNICRKRSFICTKVLTLTPT